MGLDLNSPYAYVLWGDHFSDTSVVALAPGETVVGFVTGFHPPRDPATIFIWQVGVSESVRGEGVGGRMLDELLERTGARWLEATVTPSNEASAALFRGTAARHRAEVHEELVYPGDLFPDGHEPEVRFRVGPLEGTTRPVPD